MKANEAPENMYIPKKIYLPYKDGKVIGLVKETGVPFKSGVDGNIEYIQTNAFIDKACEWLSYNNDLVDGDVPDYVESFKNYMKGE